MPPIITVVIYSKNQRSGLERSIRRVLDQDCAQVELVVVDGGSEDGTREMLENYSGRLRFESTQLGRAEGFNLGVSSGGGEVLTCLDAGNFYLPGCLAAVTEVFSRFAEVEWLTSLSWVATDASGQGIDVVKLPGISREAFLEGAHLPGACQDYFGQVSAASTFWRRSLWEEAGPFDCKYESALHFDLCARFFRRKHWLYCLAAPLAGEPLPELEEGFLAEAQSSLKQLRSDLHWRASFTRKIALALQMPTFALWRRLPAPHIWTYPWYQYHARTIVRRNIKSSTDAKWVISPLRYFKWNLSDWRPFAQDDGFSV